MVGTRKKIKLVAEVAVAPARDEINYDLDGGQGQRDRDGFL
ncbi:MAG TPA: hypothetical protein VMZ26_05210 [Pyrinomonadaceae bacterium]|nr:hypothetical protein [Pyrinomonadaceae bacterium]